MIENVYILGHCWKVQTVKDMHDFGECDLEHRIIKVKKDQSHEQMVETLIHEINHAIWRMTEIKNRDKEETTVARLSTGLADAAFTV